MKLEIRLAGLVGLTLAAAACTPAEPPEAAPSAGVFDPLVGTVDRARGVQQTVDEQAEEQRRRIEEAAR